MVYTAGEITVTFYEQHVATMTQADFIKQVKHHGFTDAQLKEVHALCKKLAKKD
jgi:hypothetical protein